MNAAHKQALEAARETARDLGELYFSEMKDRRRAPGAWYRYHRYMAEHLPRWRWARRMWHRRRALQYAAHMTARKVGC